MKKEYTMPESSVRLANIRTSLLAGSVKPDGTQRQPGTDASKVGGTTDSYDARKRMFTIE